MSTGDLLALLTIVLGVVVVLVLAAALIVVRQRLERISQGLATLASALEGVEAEHLRPLEGAVKAINAQFDIILGALPGIARKAAIVAERRPQMTTLWWIGDIVLLVVVIPVVLYLLNGVLSAARSIVPSVRADREPRRPRGRRTSTRRRCC